jgi:TolA-binding protein
MLTNPHPTRLFCLLALSLAASSALAQPPDEEPKLFEQARATLFAGKHAEAETLFRQLIKQFPEGKHIGEAYAHLGGACMQQGKHREALAAYDTLIRDHLKSVDQNTAGCTLYFKAFCLPPDAWEEASALLNRVIKEYPDSFAVDLSHNLLAGRAAQQGKPEEALEHYQQALEAIDRQKIQRGPFLDILKKEIVKLAQAHPELANKVRVKLPLPQEPQGMNVLTNSSFEEADGDQPSNWGRAGKADSPPDSWRRDATVAHSGQASAVLTSPPADFNWRGSLQQVLAEVPAGTHVFVRGWVRTENLSPGGAAGLSVRCDAWDGRPMAFATTTYATALAPTQDWTRVQTHLVIPELTATVWVSAFLTGKGKAWLDDVELLVEQP